jgi:dolichyl-phosphate beta-glucosyltransferase
LLKIRLYLSKNFKDYEIIVVNDCSQDSTCDIVRKIRDKHIALLHNKANSGKGYSIRKGIEHAKKDLILFTDADLATPIEELKNLMSAIEDGADIAIASRNLKGSVIKTKQPFYRQMLGKIFPLIVRALCLRGIKDTQCGFKLFRKDVAKKVFSLSRLDRYAFDVEALFIAKKKGYSIKEVPVTWIDKPYSKVRIFRDSFVMLKDLFRIKTNWWMGRYS